MQNDSVAPGRARSAPAGPFTAEGAIVSWIISLIIGGFVGWLASIIMKTNAQMGWVANVLVGVVGAALGNWIAGLMGMAPTGSIMRFVVALAGAALLIFILRAFGMFKKASRARDN
jgi:uncharacterized membrane protein YeaQ/YmgE (transglycosylase-associated protein family)